LKYLAVKAVAPLPAQFLQWSNVKVAFLASRVKEAECAGIENEIVVKSNAKVVISEQSLILRFKVSLSFWVLAGDTWDYLVMGENKGDLIPKFYP